MPYEFQKEQVKYTTKFRIDEIDSKKVLLTQRKFSPTRGPPQHDYDLYEDTQRLRGFPSDQSTTNLSSVELMSAHDENFEDADLYFGEEAKENFWDLYKSDRKFKDFD